MDTAHLRRANRSSGGITGPQASVYSRAKEALDQSLPLLEGLYALYPDADGEDVTALKAVAKSQLTELVKELGMLGGPRVSRVNQYFNLLLGDATFGAAPSPKANTQLSVTDPDKINGTLGTLRDKLGLNFSGQDFVNSVDDEQDLSNFRILSDYVTSLAQSWINNLSFFGLNTTTPFFGTQLVLLSRQLSVVAESVDEVRFTLDSVFIGQAERQTLRLNFGKHDSSMYLEDLLSWIQSFASEEGPRLIQDGGKFGVQNTFLPIAQQLLRLVQETSQSNSGREELPRGFHTSRVQRALTELKSALHELVKLAKRIQHVITPAPDSELALAVTGVERNSVSFMALPEQGTQREFTVFIRGNGFRVSEQTPEVEFTAILPGKSRVITVTKRYFQSENLLVATLTFPETAIGLYDVKVTNPDEKSATLSRGFTIEA